MKKNTLFRIVLAALVCLSLTSADFAQSYVRTNPAAQRKTTFKLVRIRIKHGMSPTGPWTNAVNGAVPEDAEYLMFEARVIGLGAGVNTLNMRVEIYKPCNVGATAASNAFSRKGLFAINAVGGQNVTVDHGNSDTISVVVRVHNPICIDCPPHDAPPDPDCRPAFDIRDHLGQGPYDAVLTVASTDSATSTESNINETLVPFTSFRTRRSPQRGRRRWG